MAHIGSFVPCDSADIGITDRIMTRIRSDDSVSNKESSFSHDLNTINSILRSYTRKSLIICDEFGKGTLALDGISLMGSLLRYFVCEKRQESCPRVFLTTHYTELFDYGVVPRDNVLVQMMKTQIMMENDNQDVVYLYKIIPCSTPDLSYGLACARSVGIPCAILDRAKELMPKLLSGDFVPPLNQSRLKNEEECEDVIKQFLGTDLSNQLKREMYLSAMRYPEDGTLRNSESSNPD